MNKEEINLIIRSMKVAKTFPFLRKLKISRKDTILLLNYIDNLQSALEEIREYINTHRLFYCEPDEEELFEYVNDLRVKQDLLQIIDKSLKKIKE